MVVYRQPTGVHPLLQKGLSDADNFMPSIKKKAS